MKTTLVDADEAKHQCLDSTKYLHLIVFWLFSTGIGCSECLVPGLTMFSSVGTTIDRHSILYRWQNCSHRCDHLGIAIHHVLLFCSHRHSWLH